MFLLVPAYLGCPGQIPHSCKTVVCVQAKEKMNKEDLTALHSKHETC